MQKQLDQIRHRIHRQKLESPWMHVKWKDETKSEAVVELYYGREADPGAKRVTPGVFTLAELEALFPPQQGVKKTAAADSSTDPATSPAPRRKAKP